MPWRVETVMSQRKEFVALARSEGVIMSELCLRSGISRKTGYKWLRRYLEGGEQRLDDLPKRPHHSPNRTSDDMEQVVDLRREHPTKGVSIARTYGPVVARVIEPPCGPVDGLLSPLGLRVNHLLSVEQGPVG